MKAIVCDPYPRASLALIYINNLPDPRQVHRQKQYQTFCGNW